MPRRHLSLRREVLASLEPAELASVAGAAPISTQHPLCVIGTTSQQWSQCHSCGIACTNDCATANCA